jgi:hypothetical protein
MAVVPHPPYFPDMAPCDLFPKLTLVMKGRIFHDITIRKQSQATLAKFKTWGHKGTILKGTAWNSRQMPLTLRKKQSRNFTKAPRTVMTVQFLVRPPVLDRSKCVTGISWLLRWELCIEGGSLPTSKSLPYNTEKLPLLE